MHHHRQAGFGRSRVQAAVGGAVLVIEHRYLAFEFKNSPKRQRLAQEEAGVVREVTVAKLSEQSTTRS